MMLWPADKGRSFIYVAGPYTKGDSALNVRRATLVADQLLSEGHYPYIPHLSLYWHQMAPHEYEVWLDLDLAWIGRCDGLIRVPGPSSGADREVEHAQRIGIPVVCLSHETMKELDSTYPLGAAHAQ